MSRRFIVRNCTALLIAATGLNLILVRIYCPKYELSYSKTVGLNINRFWALPIMFETNQATVLPIRAFLARLVRCAGVGLLIAAGILGIGTIGYRCFAGLPWVESFENATMVFFKDQHLTIQETPSGRLLVIVFALSCRLAKLAMVGVLLVPVLHRAYHQFNRDSASR
jgi:hypothetical protein